MLRRVPGATEVIRHVATGITARERIADKRLSRDSDVACWFAFKILSPSAGPARWKSWDGADASVMPEPERNTCQRRTNIFHSSIDTPVSILGRSSFGPRDAGWAVVAVVAVP